MSSYSIRFAPKWLVFIYVLICLGCERPQTQGVESAGQEGVKKLYDSPQMIHLGEITDALINDTDKASSRSVRAMAIEAKELKISLSITIEEGGKQQTIYRSTIPVKKPGGEAFRDMFGGMIALSTPKILQKESDDFIELELVINSITVDRKKPIRFKVPAKAILESIENVPTDAWSIMSSPYSGLSRTGPDGIIELPASCFMSQLFVPGKEGGFPRNGDQNLDIDVDVTFTDLLPTITKQVLAVRKEKTLVRRMRVRYYDSDEVPGRPAEESLSEGVVLNAVSGSDEGIKVGSLSMPTTKGSGFVAIETTGVTEDETILQFELRQGSDNSIYWTDEIRVPTTGFVFYPLNRSVYKEISGHGSGKKYVGILVFPIDQASEDKE